MQLRRTQWRQFVVCLVILMMTSILQPVVSDAAFEYRQFQKGMTFVTFHGHDDYLTAESDHSLEAVAQTGANWVALIVTWYQNTYNDSSIRPDDDMTPTDLSVIHAIQTIHRLGMKIMLKPHLGLKKQWGGGIEPADEKAWFDSYRAFINHYAELAEASGVEMLCVGAELGSMTQKQHTTYWLTIIDDIRRIFRGDLTYAANWSPDSAWQDFGFWKELDYVGIDAYYPLTDKKDPTVAELKQAWQRWILQIEARQRTINKQILFTEIGYRDIDGANIRPWDWQSEGTENQQEQANCYEAALETLWGKPWLQGIYWSDWTPRQVLRAYTPWGKLAETTLRTWYSKPFIPEGTPNDAANALVAIQQAESAIRGAHRQNRTRVLDVAESIFAEAIAAFGQSDFSRSESLANDATEAVETVKINIGTNYGTGPVEWHNETSVPYGESLFNATMKVTTVDFLNYSGLGAFVTGINGRNQDRSANLYWMFWIYNPERHEYEMPQVGASAYALTSDQTVQWYLESASSLNAALRPYTSVSLNTRLDASLSPPTVVVSGSISPAPGGRVNVTLEFSNNQGGTYQEMARITSAADGAYSYSWKAPGSGVFMIRADAQGVKSPPVSIEIGSGVPGFQLESLLIGCALGLLFLIMQRRRRLDSRADDS